MSRRHRRNPPEEKERRVVVGDTTYRIERMPYGMWILKANGTPLGYPASYEHVYAGFLAVTGGMRENPPRFPGHMPNPPGKEAPYAWIITEDIVNGGKYKSTVGPRRASDKMIAQAIEYGERWRIKDDDGIIYYYGRIYGEYEGFEPLDDFGGPNDGATSIEYQRSHGWEPL